MPREKVYSQEDLDEAVEKYLEGMKLRAVCKALPNVPERTMTCLPKKKRDGIEAKSPGPPPILSVEIEDDLKAWIVGMQCQEFPVSRDAILIKGNKLFQSMFGRTPQVGSLKCGWLSRFMEQPPILCLQTAQIVKHVRAEASEEGLKIFFWELSKHSIERKITSDRVFNMDETGFCQNSKTKKVVAVHGSKNVWSPGRFLISFDSCCMCWSQWICSSSAFIVPGQRLSRDKMDGCDIPGGSVTVAPKGFMNARLFEK
jgi:hypothetical protein